METVRDSPFPAQPTATVVQFEVKQDEETDSIEVYNNNYSGDIHLLDDNGNQNKEEDLNLGDTSNYTAEERNILFQRGLEYERNLKPNAALQCYLGYIQGLKNRSTFVYLPQCLFKIANIYRNQENYDRAAEFTQAEKLWYASSLCETDEIQQKIDEIAWENGSGPTDLNELNIDVLRANEYEHLAKLCWLKKQYQLALEYAGRCAKLRQHIYGHNSEKTKLSLSLFAVVYAEFRKQQYSDSPLHMGELDSECVPAAFTSKAPEVIMSSPVGGAPVSILRQRSEDGSKETEREKKQVRFHESVDEDLQQKEKEELTSMSITFIQLTVCIVMLASLGMWLYCSLDKSQSCQSLISQLHKWVRTVQYYYYTLTGPRKPL